MTNPAEFQINPYLLEADATKPPENLICVDDRWNTAGLVGWQLPGGNDGLARDMVLDFEMQAPGSFINQGIPVHNMGSLAHKTLLRTGTIGWMHHACLAFDEAQTINRSIYENLDQVYRQVEEMGLPVTYEEMEKAADASYRLDQSGLWLPSKEVHQELLEGSEEADVDAVPHLHLTDFPHKAKDFVVAFEGGLMWRTHEAFEEGNAGYFANLGTLAIEADRIATVFPVSKRGLVIASAIRTAAITRLLPTPDDSPMRIHTIGDAEQALAA